MASDKCPSCGAEINQHSPEGRWEQAVTWVLFHPILTSTAGVAVLLGAVAVGGWLMAGKTAATNTRPEMTGAEKQEETAAVFEAFGSFLIQQALTDTNNLRGPLWLARLKEAEARDSTNALLLRAEAIVLERTNRLEEALGSISKALSLSGLDGKTVWSEMQEMTLDRSRILKRLNRLAEAGQDNCDARAIPVREPGTPPGLIDLSAFYDASFNDNLNAWTDNDLRELQPGIRTLAGISFDVRGVIELNSSEVAKRAKKFYPKCVAAIPIHRKVQRLHFLHGAGIKQPMGRKVGAYVLDYVDGQTAELPIVYGQDVRDWWNDWPGVDDIETPRAVIAWTGGNAGVRSRKGSLRLYKCTHENPRPDVEVASFDFVSTMSGCAPFLVAVTVE